MNRKKIKSNWKDDDDDDDDDDDVDDTHDSPWQVDRVHSADERAKLNRIFQEEFTSMWTE
jgi:hypothetical protein